MFVLSSIQLLFFAETEQARTHRRDIILHAVLKVETWVTAGSFYAECLKVIGNLKTKYTKHITIGGLIDLVFERFIVTLQND